jgi:hypothetical protein
MASTTTSRLLGSIWTAVFVIGTAAVAVIALRNSLTW